MLKPRGTQPVFIDKCVEVLTSPSTKKCVAVAPVAYGKSICIANTVARLDAPTIILQPNKELLEQNYSKYVSYGYKASICSDSLKVKQMKKRPYALINGEYVLCDEISQVTYATIGTIISKIDEVRAMGVKYLIIDECFPYNTPIVTNYGVERIGDIFNKVKLGQNILVKSYNEQTKKFEFKKVTGASNNGLKSLLEVTHGNRSRFKCTPNHKILTIKGWKQASELLIGDAMVCSNNTPNNKRDILNKDQFDLVIGSSLGDGSIDYRAKNSFSSRLRITQGIKQKSYLEWKADILNSKEKVSLVQKNGYSQTKAVRLNSKTFYFKESHKNYEYQISKLNLKSLAILWMDDGNLSKLQNGGTLYALCHSEQLVNKLNNKIKELGIRNTVVAKTKSSSTGRPCFYIRFRKNSIHDLSKLCSKFIHPNLQYKIIDEFKGEVGSYEWDKEVYEKVSIVRAVNKVNPEEVFDIEVEDNHNFLVSTNQASRRFRSKIPNNNIKLAEYEGVVVHNCHLNTNTDSQIRELIREARIKNVLGVTATPVVLHNSFEGAMLKIMSSAKKNLFSTLSHIVQIKEMVDAGYWSKIVYDIKHWNSRGLKFNTTGAKYTKESLQVNYDQNNLKRKAIEAVKELRAEGRKSILVFVPTVKNANELSAAIEGSQVVHGKADTKDRTRIIDDFKNLKTDVIINVGVLTTGFDHPELDAIVLARPTESIALYYQILGRITRIHPDKLNGRVVDLSGNVTKFGKVENLNYEYIDGYGWGLFTNEYVLTNHPLQAVDRPTKTTLRKYASEKGVEVVTEHGKVKLWFGKYKGSQLQFIDKHYLTFMLEEFDFNGAKMKSLKNSIEIHLKLK